MKMGYVYILSNDARTTLYIGVTSNLEARILDHKVGHGSEFTSKYKLTDLIYYEEIAGMEEAIFREKQLKAWKKTWKWQLIGTANPKLLDLAKDWYDEVALNDRKKVHEDQSNDQKF